MAFNIDLRVRKGRITYAELSKVLGIHENSVARWFSASEMNEVQKRRVLNAIETIEAKKGAAV